MSDERLPAEWPEFHQITVTQVWRLTGELRFVKRDLPVDVVSSRKFKILQQRWQSSTTGATEWRDVPTEDEPT